MSPIFPVVVAIAAAGIVSASTTIIPAEFWDRPAKRHARPLIAFGLVVALFVGLCTVFVVV